MATLRSPRVGEHEVKSDLTSARFGEHILGLPASVRVGEHVMVYELRSVRRGDHYLHDPEWGDYFPSEGG